MEFATPVVGGGALALLGLMIATFFRITFLQNRREDTTEGRIKALESDNQWCNRRVTLLIFAMQQAGTAIPDAVWEPPPPVADAHKARRRRGAVKD